MKFFIKLDLRGAYNFIRMKKRKEWKTIFRTRYEHYEYTIMSFEFTNASTTCQNMINNALRQRLNKSVIAYLNDILIYSKILKQHIKHVFLMLECLNDQNLLLKLKKCEFHKKEVEFLGFVVEQQSIRIDSRKLQTMKKWETSTSIKKVQAFLRFINYNRKFIKNYSTRATSLIEFIKKDQSWKWKN